MSSKYVLCVTSSGSPQKVLVDGNDGIAFQTYGSDQIVMTFDSAEEALEQGTVVEVEGKSKGAKEAILFKAVMSRGYEVKGRDVVDKERFWFKRSFNSSMVEVYGNENEAIDKAAEWMPKTSNKKSMSNEEKLVNVVLRGCGKLKEIGYSKETLLNAVADIM